MPEQGSEEFSRALESALSFLKARDRFEHEIRTKLAEGAWPGSVIDEVLLHLTTKRIVDDERLVRAIMEHSQQGKPLGRERIRTQTLARGAHQDLIDRCLEDSTRNEQSLAEQLLRARPSSMRNPGSAGRFLVGRGFDEEVVRSVLENMFRDAGDAG
jgi:SOS response regulatory protein OraA/RecX